MKKLSESVWSNIQSRSTGEQIRKEDDINIMDKESFFNYLCKNYISLGGDQEIATDDGLDSIMVTAYKDERERRHYLIYDNVDKIKGKSKISLHITPSEVLFNILKNNYILLEHPNLFNTQYIYPKDGEVTNEFFLDVLNFILDNVSYSCDKVLRKKNRLSESVWSNIQSRSTGDTVRKEDILYDLYKYIDDNYTNTIFTPEHIKYEDDCIRVPLYICCYLNSHCNLYINNTDYITFTTINPDKYALKGMSSDFKKAIKCLKPALNCLYKNIDELYSVVEVSESSGLDYWIDFKIKPKDNSEITKKFCSQFIDFIIKNTCENCINQAIKRKKK